MEYIIAIILLMLLFSLPDALRRKRRYPHRGKRRSSPIDTPQRQKHTRPEPYSYVQPPAWSGLSGEARDIYAGLVWSELLQKPVSLRDRK